jgi:hypothetical protein
LPGAFEHGSDAAAVFARAFSKGNTVLTLPDRDGELAVCAFTKTCALDRFDQHGRHRGPGHAA